jgi:hypothetical protein
MKRSTTLYAIGIVAIVSLFGAQMVFAGDEHGLANDPMLDPHANACLEGGTLEGQCDSELLWNAGWYLIRYEHALIEQADFPAEYAWVLPHEGAVDDTHSNTGEEICLDPLPEAH